MEIIEPVKLPDVVKSPFNSLYFYYLTLTSGFHSMSLNASNSSCYLSAAPKASVEITSNDQPAQIIILYIYRSGSHCARLKIHIFFFLPFLKVLLW